MPNQSSSRLLSYLRLVRLPTVFTAMADVVAGFLMTSHSLSKWPDFAGLLASSVCLYWSGMVFNDVFDLKQDLVERPNRPIPSGEITRGTAIGFGTILIALGIGAAMTVSRPSGAIAVCLALTILAYDGPLKRTVLGPIAMGGCRFLNILLAASSVGDWSQMSAGPQFHVAAGLGIYVAGLTWFARNEAASSQRGQLAAAGLVSLMGITILAALPLKHPGAVPPTVVYAAMAVVAAIVGRRLWAAIRTPQPGLIQVTIKTMLLSIVTMDATMIYFKTGHAGYAIATVALIVPAIVLSRRFAMT